jgi:hypothetical protein
MHFANEPTIMGEALCHIKFRYNWANLNDRNYFGILILNGRNCFCGRHEGMWTRRVVVQDILNFGNNGGE